MGYPEGAEGLDATDALIVRCAADAGAFRELVDMYQAKIYGFLVNLAGRDAADDLFQEVWLRVLKASPRYEARGQGSGWLFKIARGVAMNRLSRWRPSGEADLEGVAEGVADLEPQPLDLLEREETRSRLEAALAQLPPEQREIFLLREVGELSFKEIAVELGIPLGTALSRMNYALKKLQNLLEDRCSKTT
jgi:RNA polymerase sigma-70 factor (ECF subfamily)